MFGLVPFKKNGVRTTGDSFDDFITGFFNDDFFTPIASINNFNTDIKETDTEYIVEADLPGVKKEDITLDYKDNNLIISAKRENEINEEKDNYIRRERSYGTFSRSFYIDNVDKNSIEASFNDGQLKITLPKVNQSISDDSKILIK